MRKFTRILTVLIVFTFALPLFAKHFNKEEIIKNLPKMLGANNAGREFYFTFLPCIEENGPKNDLRVYVSSGVRTKVVLSVPGKGYSRIQYTKPNDVIQFVLSPAIGQPYRKTINDEPEPDQVWQGAAVRVVADDPIICYGMTRYSYTSDGFLAIPVPALGKDYIVASYEDPFTGQNPPWISPSYSGIVAAYDKTKVRFTMGGNDWSKTAGGTMPGESSSWLLNEGDVLLIAGLGANADITGSTIHASKPVGVVDGNYCPFIPSSCGCCDVIEEMELPEKTWGTEYHVTKIANRLKNSIIRIFAKEPSTTIYRDYFQMGFLQTAGGEEGIGFLDTRAAEGKPRPVVISGNKPISVTQYNTSQQDDGIVSDPFQLVLTPTEQYQREIIFNTPGIKGGYGFTTNYINLCYEANSNGTMPEDLEFATVIAGKFVWQKMVSMSPNPGVPFVRLKNSKYYYSKTILLPGDGVYKLKSSKPFAAYAYGFANYDSYGFPTSVALGDLTKIDTLPPKPEWKITCDGNVNLQKTRYVTDKPDDPKNRSNLSIIYMHNDVSYNYKLFKGNFMPCEDAATSWGLKIIDNSEDAFAAVTFADCRGNDTTLFIQYDAVKLKLVPKVWDFGRHSVGDIVDKKFYIVNYSETSTSATELDYLKLLRKDDKNDPQGFTLLNAQGTAPLQLPQMIQPMDSLPFIVRFTATKEGKFWDSVGLGDTCNFWYKSYVQGSVGNPVIEVSDWDYPPTALNNTSWGQFDVKNIGTVDLELYGYKGPFLTGKDKQGNTYSIYLSQDLEDKKIDSAQGVTLTLKPQESITFQIRFTPDKEISYPDSIVFISNTANKTTSGISADSVCVLTGIGVQSKLQANGYNWGRKRIDRPATFPIGAYPAEIASGQDSVIRIVNKGTASVTILRTINDMVTGDSSAFEFNRGDLLVTLLPDSSKVIPVKFHPKKTGLYVLRFHYETNPTLANVVTTELRGTGIVPKIATYDYDFGKTIKDDYLHPQKKTVVFKNLSLSEFAEGDSVTITDLTAVNVGESTTQNWLTQAEPFRYDKSSITFPQVIQPGDSLVIPDVEFVAKSGNPVTASLSTVSDADQNVTSNWTGDGLLQSIDVTGANATICVGSTADLPVVLHNTNETDLKILSITIAGSDPAKFTFVNQTTSTFTLASQTRDTVMVRYIPGLDKGIHTADIIVRTNALNKDSVKVVTIQGQAVHYDRVVTINPATNINPIPIDKMITRKIVLEPGSDMAMAKVTGFHFRLLYNGDFLKIDNATGVKLGSMLPANNFSITNFSNRQSFALNSTDTVGILLFDIVAKNNTIINNANGGVLAEINIGTYLPKKDTRVSNLVLSTTVLQDKGDNNLCVDIKDANGQIVIDSTCVFAIRKVVYIGGQTSLNTIKPNPVSGSEATIGFDIGATDCQTTIEIYNESNQLVVTPINKVMQPGRYEVKVPIVNLPSGAYFIRMKAANFEQIKKMIIVK